MNLWYMRVDRVVVKQRTLFDLPSRHRLSSCLNRTESASFRPFNQDFFNGIGSVPAVENQTYARSPFARRCYLSGSGAPSGGITCATLSVIETAV